jgi:hypothetical protein
MGNLALGDIVASLGLESTTLLGLGVTELGEEVEVRGGVLKLKVADAGITLTDKEEHTVVTKPGRVNDRSAGIKILLGKSLASHLGVPEGILTRRATAETTTEVEASLLTVNHTGALGTLEGGVTGGGTSLTGIDDHELLVLVGDQSLRTLLVPVNPVRGVGQLDIGRLGLSLDIPKLTGEISRGRETDTISGRVVSEEDNLLHVTGQGDQRIGHI